MEKEFVPYGLALRMKTLGFDEVFRLFDRGVYFRNERICEANEGALKYFEDCGDEVIIAPTFSQTFRWFREKYDLYHSIGLDNSLENDINCDYQIINHSQSISELETDFKTYEEAESACLKKLIEIVESKSE